MKGFVRLIALAAAVFALSGIHGGENMRGDGVLQMNDAVHGRASDFQSSIFSVHDREQEDADWCNRTALNDAGLEFSAARPVSQASRVRNFSDERNNSPQQHSRTGFLRSGKTVCTARPANFMLDCITSPVSGSLSGLSAAVALERLRI